MKGKEKRGEARESYLLILKSISYPIYSVKSTPSLTFVLSK